MTVSAWQQSLALVRTLVGYDKCSADDAASYVERAEWLGVDVFDVLAASLGLNPTVLYKRAAEHFGVRFHYDIRRFISPFETAVDLDKLAELRSYRGQIGGRSILFIAPQFKHLVTLACSGALQEAKADICIVAPSDLRLSITEANKHHLADEAVQRLIRQFPDGAAILTLSPALRWGFAGSLLALVLLTMAHPFAFQPYVLAAITVILALPSLFRLWAASTAGQNIPLDVPRLLPDEALPVYSVLIPLRDEAHMVPQIATAMRRLDYPAEKLDIKFVVESESTATVLAARRELWDSRFNLVIVPDSLPRTKPKATNYALPLVRGRHVVIYDAEDVPDRQQLRRAASLFAARPDLACLQAQLLIANTKRHWITRMFAAEYAGHFGVLLPAITRAQLPMPLGGTSNHFRISVLKEVGGWDAFNVTEDADLGLRLARLGYRCASFSAWTSEEAPDSIPGWVRQRTRWMKGWMQTLLVHTRRPVRLLKDLGWRNMAAFEIFVGSMVVSILLHGLFLVATIGRIGVDLVRSGTADPWSLASIATLLFGYAGAAAVSVIGLHRAGRPDLIKHLAGLPVYWLLAWYAVVAAAIELVTKPYHWAKTEHKGFSTESTGPENQAEEARSKMRRASSRFIRS